MVRRGRLRWFGHVEFKNGTKEVSFLQPHGSSKPFKYSNPADILLISYEDILTSVNPTTATGRTYSLITQD